MKFKLSKRWFTNLLIILFGFLVLSITILTSLNFWTADADNVYLDLGVQYPTPDNLNISNMPTYRINRSVPGANYPFLEIYNQSVVNNAFGGASKNYPAYKVPFKAFSADGTQQIDMNLGVVPLVPYNLLDSFGVEGYAPSEYSPAMSLYNYAKTVIGNNQSSDLATINSSIELYNQAIRLYSKNYVIDQNRLYSADAQFQQITTTETNDVRRESYFPGRSSQRWSLSVSIKNDEIYADPATGSLALKVLESASRNCSRYGDQQERELIDGAMSRYKSQIPNTTDGQGLTLSAAEQVEYGGDSDITFGVDFTKFDFTDDKFLKTLQLNIHETTVCSVSYTNINDYGTITTSFNTTPPPCEWDGQYQKRGTFRWNSSSSVINTNMPGSKVISLKAFYSTGEIAKNASKTILVLNDTRDGEQSGNGVVPMSITVPHSVSKEDTGKISAVPIKISASNLNPNGNGANDPNRVGKISWFVCTKPRAQVIANDSTGCFEKGTFGPFTQINPDSFQNHTENWNASNSAPGTYSIMLKAFQLKPSVNPTNYPYIEGTKTVSDNIIISDDPLPGNGGGNGGGGDAGGGYTNPIVPDWAANFASSGVRTISDVLNKLGPFTLLILGILAIVAVILAGMKYITSGGDSKASEAGKKGVLFAVYGIILAVLCVMLVKVTVKEVQGIIGNSLSDPGNPDSLLLNGFAGPNASIGSIIDHDTGFIWRWIQLAVYYAEAIAAFYILYASFIYITSFGDEGKAESGKKTLIWAIIGLAFILSANTLLVIFGKIVI